MLTVIICVAVGLFIGIVISDDNDLAFGIFFGVVIGAGVGLMVGVMIGENIASQRVLVDDAVLQPIKEVAGQPIYVEEYDTTDGQPTFSIRGGDEQVVTVKDDVFSYTITDGNEATIRSYASEMENDRWDSFAIGFPKEESQIAIIPRGGVEYHFDSSGATIVATPAPARD